MKVNAYVNGEPHESEHRLVISDGHNPVVSVERLTIHGDWIGTGGQWYLDSLDIKRGDMLMIDAGQNYAFEWPVSDIISVECYEGIEPCGEPLFSCKCALIDGFLTVAIRPAVDLLGDDYGALHNAIEREMEIYDHVDYQTDDYIFIFWIEE